MEADAGLEDPLYKTQDDEEPQVGADGEFNEGLTLEKEEDEQMEADVGLEDPLYKKQTQDDEEPQVGADGEFNEGQTLEKEEDEQMEADAGLEDPLYKTQDDEEPQVGADGEFNEGQTLEKEEEEQMEADSGLEDHLYKEQTQDDEEPHVGVDGEFNEGQTLEEEEEQIEADAGLEDPVVVERQEERRGNKEQTQDDEEPQVGADGEFNEGQTLEEEKEQMEADAGLKDPVVVERQKEGRRNKEQKKSGEKRKDEAHEKDKEKNQDEDGSMSNSEKLDKLLQMVYDLSKRVEVIQNVLGVKVPDGSSNKQDYENAANFFDDTKGAPNDENEEEANPGDKRNAANDGNDEEIIDKEAFSATQQLTEVNTIGENEITEKTTQDEETEKMENESFKKQKSQVTSSSQTFTIPNFDTRVTSPTPTYTTLKFDLLSQESRSSVKCATEVLMRDVGEKSEFQPLKKTKKRSVQQDNQRYLGPSSQYLSDGEEEKCTAVDICKIRPSRPLNLCAEYELQNIVEVFVGYGWRKGVVKEIYIDNHYKVCFEDTKEEAVLKNSDIRRFMEWQNNVWIEAHMKGFENEDNANVPNPNITSNVCHSSTTPVLESSEVDMMSDAPTEIRTPRDIFNKNHEMDNGTTIDAEPPIGERMSTSADKIVLPKRVFEPGSEKGVLDRVKKHCTLKYVAIVKEALGSDFKKIEDSFLGPIIQMGMRDKAMVFSRNLIHELLLRRIKVGKKDLWFSFGEQLMRFSLREFHFATGLPCLVGEEEKEEEASATKKKKKDPWMMKNHTVKTLVELFVKNSEELTANQKLRLGATILVESILIANNPVNKIPVERLLRARNFNEFCKYPWGNETYDALRAAVEKITTTDLVKEQYGISGFIYAIQLWALSSVDQLGSFFGDEDEETQFPLCLHWIRTKSPTMDEVTKIASNKKVVVKCILGDPELHSNLVEDVDTEFGKVVDLVKRGYRLKRQDWRSGSVNIAVAEAEIEENNYGPGTDATDKEKIEFLTKQLEIYKKEWSSLKIFWAFETDEFHATPQAATKTKENDKNLEREAEDDVNLQFYIDSRRQQVSKGQIEEAERNGEEVAISGEGSETSKDNEKDEEENEDASKEPEQVLEKKQGKRKKDRMEEVENVNEDTTNICKEVKKKKPRREKKRNTDEEPVNDDTVVDEDGKADEPNQVRKNKRGRGNKGAGARTSKSKKQKIQPRDVSADDVIGGVLEDLNLKEQEEEEQVDDEAEKPVQVEQKKRGRPAGRKNKTHEGKEQQGEANDEAEKPKKGEKNKPGRKGKTNEEKKQQVEADDEVKKAEKGEKKKPGRPAGRKGKTNEEKNNKWKQMMKPRSPSKLKREN
ncbi:hypothetical protein Bca4012_058602 [Brassica carinata]